MKRIDKVLAMNSDEFVEWLLNEAVEEPWDAWFDNMFCHNCEPVCKCDSEHGYDNEYGWCELNGKCKFFQELDDMISRNQIAKMWFDMEDEDELLIVEETENDYSVF